MHARGQTLLTKENELYSTSLDPKESRSGAAPPPNGLSKSDQVFIQQILTSGTSSDRISALVLLVSSSPVHTTSFLDQLAGLCRKKSRDESLRAMRSLVGWWCGEGGGAPPRKLRYFSDQPLLPTVAAAYEVLEKKGKHAVDVFEGMTKADVERSLVLFTFEDWLKRWFFQILQSLEVCSSPSSAHEIAKADPLRPHFFPARSKCRSTRSLIPVRRRSCTFRICCETSRSRRATSCACSSTSS